MTTLSESKMLSLKDKLRVQEEEKEIAVPKEEVQEETPKEEAIEEKSDAPSNEKVEKKVRKKRK